MEPSPASFVHIQQFADYMVKKLPKSAIAYVQSAADNEITLKRNTQDFENYCIRPHLLRDVSSVDTRTTILGADVSMPICVAPTGYQKLFHHDGEVASAKAAASMQTLWTMSTMATTSVEDLTRAVPDSVKWHQIYVFRNRALTEALVRRAVRCGFRALVLTIDAPIAGKRIANLTDKVFLPPPYTVPNMDDAVTSETDLVSGCGLAFDPSLDWTTISWLKRLSGLPVVVKGVLTSEDASLAIGHGADAVWVSNHGGRQLDYTPSSISVLAEVVRAVDGRAEVYVDGGVRTGAHVFIALALGARAVFIGRPAIWGLTSLGEAGAKRVLEILQEELATSMALAGCRDLKSITESHVTLNKFVGSKL